jgi:hypothetical protein
MIGAATMTAKQSRKGGEEPKTLSVPEAGRRYFNLSKNGSYAAAERGEIPYVTVGRLKRVPVIAMDRKLAEAK